MTKSGKGSDVGMRASRRAVADAGDSPLLDPGEISLAVDQAVQSTPVVDMHTHLFAPQFGSLNLWGIDELLTYHYLIAELFRSAPIDPQSFFELDRAAQADLIWKALFVQNTPLSEATRGVVAVLTSFGLDPSAKDLREARSFFSQQDAHAHFERVLEMANVSDVVMTNDPLDDVELEAWGKLASREPRFHAALRMDGILNEWETKWAYLEALGFEVSRSIDHRTLGGMRHFLAKAISRLRPLYLAVSLPDTFVYPEESVRGWLIRDLVLPACREHGLPFALMIGVKRQVNPALRLAGDGVGRASMDAVDRLCAENPGNRFLVTLLSRENQHELCVSARKFANLMPFGCWWFLNNPSIIEEVTRERIELLGTSFIAQHSDARVFEQLIYKWRHSRRILGKVLVDAYQQLLLDGRSVTRSEIERDVQRMFSGNFRNWTSMGQG